MINRRNFLKNASLFTLGGLMAGKVGNAVAAQPATSAAFEATAAKNIGLQIYSLGDGRNEEAEKDGVSDHRTCRLWERQDP